MGCAINCGPIAQEGAPKMDSRRAWAKGRLACRAFFIAESEADTFIKEKIGKLAGGVALYAPQFRGKWRNKTIIKIQVHAVES